ncbi:MAG: MFS transporter [Chitinophagaceae bacterium]|nr:MFS transporter [Oligoflexus sp.]
MNSRTLLLGLVFLSSSFNFALTLQPMLLTESGTLMPIQAGLTLAMGSLLSGVMQPLIGNLLDQGRVKRSFFLVAISYILGIFGYWNPGAPAWQLVASCLVLVMAGLTLRTIVSMALIASCQGAERAEASSMRYLVSNAALAVSSSISLVAFKDWRRELLLVDLVTSLVLAAGMLRHLKRSQGECSKPRASISESKNVLIGAMKIHGKRIVGLSMVTICFSANLTYLPLLFAKRGLANTDVSASILMANALIVLLAAKPLRRLTRRWGPQRIGKIGTILIASGMCFGPMTTSLTWVLAGIVIWTLGEVIFIPWEQLQLFNCFDHAPSGLASGAVSFLFSICQILAPVLSTVLLALPESFAAVTLTALPIVGYWIYRTTVKNVAFEDQAYNSDDKVAA